MGETAELPGQAGSVPVRRMRVAGPVGKGVMTTVDGDPADDLTLEAHRPRDSQRDPQRRRRREAAVGEQPVEADGHSEPRHQVENYREQHIRQAQAVAPGKPYRHPEPGERHDDDRERHRYPDCARDRARRAADIREWLRTFITGSGLNSHRGVPFWAMPETQNTATARQENAHGGASRLS